MGDSLPTSQAGQTLNPGISPLDIQPYTDTTPALAALQVAFQKGLVSQEQLMSVFDRSRERVVRGTTAQEDIAASKARQELLPGQTALIKAKTQGELGLLPSEITARQGALTSQIALQPGATDIAKAGQGAALPEAKLLEVESKTDPTGGHTQARKLYQQYNGGVVLKDANGNPDYEGMATSNQRMLQRMIGMQILPQQKEILDTLKSYGPAALSQAYNADGTVKSTGELKDVLAKAKPDLKPAELQAEGGALLGLEKGLDSVKAAQDILVKDPDAVGPKYNQGSYVGEKVAQGGALLGNAAATARFDAQKRLKAELALGIMDAIRSLKGTGAIRNTELVQIEKGQPTLDSTKSQWDAWLKQSQEVMERAYAMQKEALPGGPAQLLAPPGGSLTPGSAAPSAPAAATQPDVTAAEYQKLNVGDKYYWKGKQLTKTQ